MKPAPIGLLGNGVDAIIQHTRPVPESWVQDWFFPARDDNRLPTAPTELDRILRYRTASCVKAGVSDNFEFEQREQRGLQLQHDWAQFGFVRSGNDDNVVFLRRRHDQAARAGSGRSS